MTTDESYQQAGQILERLFHEAECRRLLGAERLGTFTSLQGRDLILEAQKDTEGALYIDLVLPQTARPAGLSDTTVETTALRLSFDLGSARELADTITDWLDHTSKAADATI